ncbi:unnamed protein product [Cunninghamella blakesleeana]
MNPTLLGPSPLGYYNHRKYEFLELLNEIKECLLHDYHQAAASTKMTITKYGKPSILLIDDDEMDHTHHKLTTTTIIKERKKMKHIKMIFIIDLLTNLMNHRHPIICVQWNLNQGFHLTFQDRTLSSLDLFHLFPYSTITMNTFIHLPSSSYSLTHFYLLITINETSSSLFISDSPSSLISLPSLSRRGSLCSSLSSLSTCENNNEDGYRYDDNNEYDDNDDDYQGNEALFHLIQDTLHYIHSSTIYSNELKTLESKLDDFSLNASFLLE